ncbi:phospholipase C type enzyme [Recurvomyces mirabilis]|uniref:Phospholipase C type enzyme n=1 Tax=Recurvomyces mirabilis TaxID=574656 RepID=A0AAE0WSX4_9PEZI|nr:phospholipase C type enzyme [Recurvomyces mirabilis]KAK5156957.1 phospholipase C type enzyme [Recurvomyces mirabilis]
MSSAASFRSLVGMQPSTASPSDSALIIIDAQNEYAEGKLKVSNAPESRKAISQLLEKYRSAGGKVVHVVHKVPDGAPVFTPDTPLAKEFDELKPKDGEKYIEKLHPSSFADTELHDYLQGTGAKKVVLTGYMAHVCVSTTARDADRLGYDVLVAEDAVGDRDIPGATGAEATKMTMTELGDAFATIVQSKDIK